MAKQGWWNRNWESESTHLPTRWMYPRFEYCGRKSIHYIEFVYWFLTLAPGMFFWFPSIYMRPNVDGSKHQENQVKVTDVKRCSDLFRAFKKQITIQAKLSCCYCSGSVVSHLLFSVSARRNSNFCTYYMAHNKTMMTKLACTCCRSRWNLG